MDATISHLSSDLTDSFPAISAADNTSTTNTANASITNTSMAATPSESSTATTQAENTTVILRSFDNGESHSIVSNMLVGRESDCGICLHHSKISRYHAKVRLESGVIYINDLQSSNGTFVNGKRVTETTAVEVGDEVQFGDQRYRLTTVANTVISEATLLSEPSLVASNSAFTGDDTPTTPHLNPDSKLLERTSGEAPEGDSTRIMTPELLRNTAQRNSFQRNAVTIGQGPRLIVNSAPIRGQTFSLQEQLVLHIGRDASNDVVLPDPSVSRQHATITQDGEGYLIQTHNPSNGLLVNGFKVQQWRLREGDSIQLGRMALSFKTDDPGQKLAPTPAPLDDIDLIKYSLIGLFLIAGVILAVVPFLI